MLSWWQVAVITFFGVTSTIGLLRYLIDQRTLVVSERLQKQDERIDQALIETKNLSDEIHLLRESIGSGYMPSAKLEDTFDRMMTKIDSLSEVVSKLSRDFHYYKGVNDGGKNGKS